MCSLYTVSSTTLILLWWWIFSQSPFAWLYMYLCRMANLHHFFFWKLAVFLKFKETGSLVSWTVSQYFNITLRLSSLTPRPIYQSRHVFLSLDNNINDFKIIPGDYLILNQSNFITYVRLCFDKVRYVYVCTTCSIIYTLCPWLSAPCFASDHGTWLWP